MRHSVRFATVMGMMVLAWCAVGATRAPADVGCTYDAGTRTVTLTMLGGFADLDRHGQQIYSLDQPCGAATVSNTDTVDVEGSVVNEEFLLDELHGRFAGIHFDLHVTDADYVDVFRGDTNDTITIGTLGISLDTDTTLDMTYIGGQPTVHLNTAAGSDHLSGMGGHGTGDPTSVPLNVVFDVGGDVVHGGNGNDTLARFEYGTVPTTDRIYGEGGNDTTGIAPTDDGTIISGGPGIDSVGDSIDSRPVSVSLDNVANDGAPGQHNNVMSDVERVTGGPGDDSLIGDNDPNTLNGGGGNDHLVGGWGSDQLIGARGDDTLDAGNGMHDNVLGGDGNDTVTIDCGTPADHVDSVETTTCAPAPPPKPAAVGVTFATPPGGHLSATDPATAPVAVFAPCATPLCGSDVCDTRWRLRTNGGLWELLPTDAPQPTLSRSFPIGTGDTYQLEARNVGCNGIVGVARVSRTFTVTGADQSAATLSAEWSPVADPAAWGGTLAQTGAAGTATFGFTGFGVAWIGQRGPALGASRARLDGAVCPASSEHSIGTLERRVIAVCSGVQKAHTLVVGPGAPSTGSTVDGFVVLSYS